MCSYSVSLTVGHESETRASADGSGYYSGETHDWRLYVRGAGGEDISRFVSKIVFTLHRSYTYPKRVIHEPPYEIRESGYGCFEIPIYIYIKHSTNPRKIKFRYKLFLQNHKPLTGSKKYSHIFVDPPEIVKNCLMEGGARIVEPKLPEAITKVPDMDPVSKVLSVNLRRMNEEQLKRKQFQNSPVDSKRRKPDSEKNGDIRDKIDNKNNVKKDTVTIKREAVIKSEVKRTLNNGKSDVKAISKKPNARTSDNTESEKVSEATILDGLKKACSCVEMSVSEIDLVSQLYLSIRKYEKSLSKDRLKLPSFTDPIFRPPELPPSLKGLLPEDDDIGRYVLR